MIITLVLSLTLILTVTTVVLAQGEQPPGPEEYTLTSMLLWVVAGPGAAYLTGLLVTQVLENIAFWHKIPSQIKFILTLLVAGLLPIFAQALLAWSYLPEIEPSFNIAVQAIIVWLASQSGYRTLKTENAKLNQIPVKPYGVMPK